MTYRPLHFHSAKPGARSAAQVSADPRHVRAVKRPVEVSVGFSAREQVISTREGDVVAQPGDAILTDAAGHRWPVQRAAFLSSYEPVAPTQAGAPGTYCKRAITVLALRMQQAFRVTLADGVSVLDGQAGDWLVDYGDGNLGVVSADILSATYNVAS